MAVNWSLREYLYQKEVDGKTFYYAKIGSERHGAPSFIMWVSPKLVKKNENGEPYITYPIKGISLTKGQKDYVLKFGDNILYYVFVQSGYRGNSSIKILSPVLKVVKFYIYRSQLGTCGIGEGALVEANISPIKVQFQKTGKTYGAPKNGILIYYENGDLEEIPSDALDDALLSLE